MKPNLTADTLAMEFLEHEVSSICSTGNSSSRAVVHQRLRKSAGKTVQKMSNAFAAGVASGKITSETSVDEAYSQVITGMGPLAAFILSSVLKALAYRFIAWALSRMTDD